MRRRLSDDARVRPLEPGDDAEIRRLFRATLAMGRPLPFPVPDLDAYERLSLDWFLGPGRDAAAVLDDGGRIMGYTLIALNHDAYRRWVTPRALAWAARALAQLALGRGSPQARRFTWLRLKDGYVNWRHGSGRPQPAVMHVNLARGARASGAGVRLAAHADEVIRAAGLPGWYGEVNAPAGRRAEAIARLGARVVHRVPNHTMTWLAGTPVERLTVVRLTTWPRIGGPGSAG